VSLVKYQQMAPTKKSKKYGEKREFIKSPRTGLKVRIGSPTYEALLKDPMYSAQTKKARKVSRISKSRGCSRNRKWERKVQAGEMKKSDFCGPAGGTACDYAFPADTKKHIAAARRYRRYAPNIAGLEKCLKSHEKAL